MYYFAEYVDVGGLMSYGPNRVELYRRAAVYVDKIVKGARPDAFLLRADHLIR